MNLITEVTADGDETYLDVHATFSGALAWLANEYPADALTDVITGVLPAVVVNGVSYTQYSFKQSVDGYWRKFIVRAVAG